MNSSAKARLVGINHIALEVDDVEVRWSLPPDF